MYDLPTIELLESTHSFPGGYMFKVIGRAEGNFIGRAVAAVRMHLSESVEPPFSSRKTSNGAHVSVTIEPSVSSAEDVLAIYQTLRDLDGLVMLL